MALLHLRRSKGAVNGGMIPSLAASRGHFKPAGGLGMLGTTWQGVRYRMLHLNAQNGGRRITVEVCEYIYSELLCSMAFVTSILNKSMHQDSGFKRRGSPQAQTLCGTSRRRAQIDFSTS